MKKIADWINSHKIITIGITLFLFVVQPIFVHWMFKAEASAPFWVKTWGPGDLLTYVAGFETFIGTVFLGVVAVRQNDKANELNKRLLDLEKASRRPFLAISDVMIQSCPNEDVVSRSDNFLFQNDYNGFMNQGLAKCLYITFENVTANYLDFDLNCLRITSIHNADQRSIYEGFPNNNIRNAYKLNSKDLIPFNFVISSGTLMTMLAREIIIELEVRNIIGEVYKEIISFSSHGFDEGSFKYYNVRYNFEQK